MEYNKNRFSKINDKKSLHKVKKQWVVVSSALLLALGGSVVMNASAHASSNPTTPKGQINQNLHRNNQINLQKSNLKANSQVKTNYVNQQATNLHRQILNNAHSQIIKSNIPKVNQKNQSNYVNHINHQFNNSKTRSENINSYVNSINQKFNYRQEPQVKTSSPSTIQTGRWGTAYWKLYNDNTWQIYNGTLPNVTRPTYGNSAYGDSINLPDYIQNNQNSVHHITFNNVKAGNSLNDAFGWGRFGQLESIDFNGLDTKNTISFQSMLAGKSNLQSIKNFNKLNASNVTTVDSLFMSDNNVRHIDFTNLDTHNVRWWGGVFFGDSGLEDIKGLNTINTQSAIDMNDTFGMDSSLTNLDLTSFNTQAAIANLHPARNQDGLSKLIDGDTSLHHIELGENTLLTNQAINGNLSLSMAYDPQTHQILQLANNKPHPGSFDLLQGIKSRGTWGTATWIMDSNNNLWLLNGDMNRDNGKVTGSLNRNNIANIYTNNVIIPTHCSDNVFDNLSNVKYIDLSGANTSNCNYFGHMFMNDYKLKGVNLHGLDVENVENIGDMFQSDTDLEYADLSNLNFKSCTNLGEIFWNDHNLATVNLNNLQIPHANGGWDQAFQSDTNLKYLDFRKVYAPNVTNYHKMLTNDNNLSVIMLGNPNNFKLGNAGLTGTWVNQNGQSVDDTNIATQGTYYRVSDCVNGTINYLFGNQNVRQYRGIIPKEFSADDAPGLPSGYAVSPQDTTNYQMNSDGTLNIHVDKAGEWGTADWYLNTQGHLLVADGQTSFVPGGLSNFINNGKGITGPLNPNDIISISTSNLYPPANNENTAGNPSQSSHYYWSAAYNTWSNLPNVRNIDLTGVHYENCNDLTDMFYGDNKLSDLNMSNVDDRKAISNQIIGGSQTWGNHGNGINGIFTGVLPKKIELGPNTLLTGNVDLSNQSNRVIFGSATNNPGDLTILDDGQPHPGTWNVMYGDIGKWGSATWGFDAKTGTLHIANGQITDSRTDASNLNWSDVKHIDTYDVTAPSIMDNLFSVDQGGSNISNLQTADLSGMDTTNTTSMTALFQNDKHLTNINLNGTKFDTSKLTNMSFMFDDDSDLRTLTFGPNFNTSNVNDFNYMFISDRNLGTLDLSHFNTRRAAGNKQTYLNSGDGLGSMLSSSDSSSKNYQASVPNHILILGPNTILGANGNGQTNIPPQHYYINNKGEVLSSSDTFTTIADGNAHPGTWYANDGLANVTFKYGKSVLSTQTIPTFNHQVQASELKLSKNGINYELDPRASQSISMNNGGNYTVPLDITGKWGSATWDLTPDSDDGTNPITKSYGYGNLYVHDGTLRGLGRDVYGNLHTELGINDKNISNQVKSISTHNTIAPADSSRLFDDEPQGGTWFPNLTEVNVAGLNTHQVSDMFAMFGGLQSVQHINGLTHFDTSNVQPGHINNGFNSMFCTEPNLKSIDLSNFDTKNATISDGAMFQSYHSNPQLSKIKLGSNTILDNNAGLQSTNWYQIKSANSDNYNPGNSSNAETGYVAPINQQSLDNDKNHAGTWTNQVPYVDEHINYQWHSRSVGSADIIGQYGKTGNANRQGLPNYWNPNYTAYLSPTLSSNGSFRFGKGSFDDNKYNLTAGVATINDTDMIKYILPKDNFSDVDGFHIQGGSANDSNGGNTIDDPRLNNPSKYLIYYEADDAVNHIHGNNPNLDFALLFLGWDLKNNTAQSNVGNNNVIPNSNGETVNQFVSNLPGNGYPSDTVSGHPSQKQILSQVAQDIVNSVNSKTNSSQVVGQGAITGDDYREDNTPTYFTISTSNMLGLPTGYHVINATNYSFNYDKGIHYVDVAPNQITLHYINSNGQNGDTNLYNQSNNKVVNTTECVTNNYALHNSDIPPNYSRASNQNNSILTNVLNNGSVSVYVQPNQVNEHIEFQQGNNTVISTNKNGLYGYTSDISAPSGYHFTNGQAKNSFTYDGGTIKLSVQSAGIASVIYKNQNNETVGSYSLGAKHYGDNCNLSNIKNSRLGLQRGYTITGNQANNIKITSSNEQIPIYVLGNKANLKILMMNNGTQIDSDKFNGINDIGDTISDIRIPYGYHLDTSKFHQDNGILKDDNLSYKSSDLGYTFSSSDISSDKTVTINGQPQTVENMKNISVPLVADNATVTIKFIDSDGNDISGYNYQINSQIGKSDTVGNIPKGYALDDNSENHYVFLASQIKAHHNDNDLMNDYDVYVHSSKQMGTLRVIYLNQNGTPVGKSGVIRGTIGDKIDVTNKDIGGEPIPKGYALNSNEDINNFITNNNSTIYLRVHGLPITTNVNVIRILEDNGKTLISNKSDTVNGNNGDVATVSANDNGLTPTGYHVDKSHSISAPVLINDYQKPVVVFYYQANKQAGAPITVNYINHGRLVKHIAISGGNAGSDKVNGIPISSIINNNVPTNYTLDNSVGSYEFSKNNQCINLNITGNPITTNFIVHRILINGSDSSSSDVNVTLHSHIGSDVTIDPYLTNNNVNTSNHSLVPSDYHPGKNSSALIRVNDNGSISPLNKISYVYYKNYQPTPIKSIRIHYIDTNNNNSEVDEESDQGTSSDSFNIKPYTQNIPEIPDNYYVMNDSNTYNNSGNQITCPTKFNFIGNVFNVYLHVKSTNNLIILPDN